MSTPVAEVSIEILDDTGAGTSVKEFNTGDVDIEVTVGSTASQATAQQTTVVEVASGIPGEGAGFKIVASDIPPSDQSALWLDTSP